jgi:hypothetical protein
LYFEKLNLVFKVDIPYEIQLNSANSVIIVQMPDIVKVAGHILFIFGGQSVAVYHLNQVLYQPSGAKLCGINDLTRQSRIVQP